MKPKYMIISIILLFIAATLMMLFVFGENDSIYGNYGSLYISEVSGTNFSIIKDEDNDYSDYIEIYNGYKFDVNLEGYHLSDKEFETDIWTFPDVTIKSGEHLIVFASGKDKQDKYLHTNFKLKEAGEIVTFTDKDNVILSKLEYKQTGYNTSYGYNGMKNVYYHNPSPGKKNGGKYSLSPIEFNKEKYDLKITEYITENTTVYDSMGDYNPMVEIYNYGKKDINLKGFYLSDSQNNLPKYSLPDVTIKKGGYVVVYLSDKNEFINNEIHTNFKIKEGEVLVLTSYHGKIIDSVDIIALPINTSYGINDDNRWCYYPTATFGNINSTKCFDNLGGVKSE